MRQSSPPYSDYKNHHTAKFLASIEPSGGFDFVRDAYSGRIDGGELTRICGLLKLVESGDVNLADRRLSDEASFR